jgi:hypothetical protein
MQLRGLIWGKTRKLTMDNFLPQLNNKAKNLYRIGKAQALCYTLSQIKEGVT